MLEHSTLTVLVKFSAKRGQNKANDDNISCAVFCQIEKMTTRGKKYSQSNLQQTETVEKVIVVINMQGQLFKCVAGAPIRFLGVL